MKHPAAMAQVEGRQLGVDAESVTTEEATIDGHRLYIQSSAPNNPSDNDIWIDLP